MTVFKASATTAMEGLIESLGNGSQATVAVDNAEPSHEDLTNLASIALAESAPALSSVQLSSYSIQRLIPILTEELKDTKAAAAKQKQVADTKELEITAMKKTLQVLTNKIAKAEKIRRSAFQDYQNSVKRVKAQEEEIANLYTALGEPAPVAAAVDKAASAPAKAARKKRKVVIIAPEENGTAPNKRIRLSTIAQTIAPEEQGRHHLALLGEIYPAGTEVYREGQKVTIVAFDEKSLKFTVKSATGELTAVHYTKLVYLPESGAHCLLQDATKDTHARYFAAKITYSEIGLTLTRPKVKAQWLDFQSARTTRRLKDLSTLLPIAADSAFAQSLERDTVKWNNLEGRGFYLKKGQ